jgi:hypothetical protein
LVSRLFYWRLPLALIFPPAPFGWGRESTVRGKISGNIAIWCADLVSGGMGFAVFCSEKTTRHRNKKKFAKGGSLARAYSPRYK